MQNILYTLVVSLQILLCTSVVLAHTSGNSYEEHKDGYLIDIGYTPEFLTQGTVSRFDFDAVHVASSSEKDVFTDIWVRVLHAEDVVFSGDIHNPEYGQAGLSMMLSEPGSYEMFVRFQNRGDEVVGTSFIFEVTTADDTSSNSNSKGVFILLSVFVGMMMCVGAWMYRRSTQGR